MVQSSPFSSGIMIAITTRGEEEITRLPDDSHRSLVYQDYRCLDQMAKAILPATIKSNRRIMAHSAPPTRKNIWLSYLIRPGFGWSLVPILPSRYWLVNAPEKGVHAGWTEVLEALCQLLATTGIVQIIQASKIAIE